MDADDRNIVLTGFMGTGKSTVGELLAERLNRPFVDTDSVIEQRFGMTIPAIFQAEGEAGFRRRESIVVQSLAEVHGQVIATGGGTLLEPTNRRLLESTGVVVCLVARPDVIERRLGDGEGRPLAPNWRALLDERHSVYDSLPHHVDTSDREPGQVAEEVLALWQSST